MIENLAKNIITTYDNLSPRKKALADMVVIFGSSVIGALAVITVISLGLWMEAGIAFICYGIWGMISLLYKSRVEHYEFQAKFKK